MQSALDESMKGINLGAKRALILILSSWCEANFHAESRDASMVALNFKSLLRAAIGMRLRKFE